MTAATPTYVLELQQAVEAALTGDAYLMTLITGVFELAPEGQPTPYITWGQHTEAAWQSFGKTNSETLFLMDIFSQAGSDDECYSILAEVRRILQTTKTNPPLVMPDYGQSFMQYEWSTILHQPDYSMRHMPVRFRSKAVEL